MKLRKKDPWKSASEYSKDLSGLTINLLVKDIKHSIHFLQKIINAKIIYQDPDRAEERARKENYIILSNSINKPHGKR